MSGPTSDNQAHGTCEAVVASGPAGLLHARCGHVRPCAVHDRPSVLADLLRHAAARRVLRSSGSTDTEREDARRVLGLSRNGEQS